MAPAVAPKRVLKDNSRIDFTQSAIVLESLVNKFFANFASKGKDSGSGDAAAGSTQSDGQSVGKKPGATAGATPKAKETP